MSQRLRGLSDAEATGLVEKIEALQRDDYSQSRLFDAREKACRLCAAASAQGSESPEATPRAEP